MTLDGINKLIDVNIEQGYVDHEHVANLIAYAQVKAIQDHTRALEQVSERIADMTITMQESFG